MKTLIFESHFYREPYPDHHNELLCDTQCPLAPQPYCVGHTLRYLTDPADAHVKGVCSAARAIQDLGRQLQHQVLAPRLALEGTGRDRVVDDGHPFMRQALVLDVVVCRALLRPEVPRLFWAVLEGGEGGGGVQFLL